MTVTSTEGIINAPSLLGLNEVAVLNACRSDDEEATRGAPCGVPFGVRGRLGGDLPLGLLSSPLIREKADRTERRAIRAPSVPHRARPAFCRTVLRVCASRKSPEMLKTSMVVLSTSLRMIVCTVSESAVKTVNFGNAIGSGSDSPSDAGEELNDPERSCL